MKRAALGLLVPLLVCLAACSRDPKAYVDSGNKYFQRGKFKEASIMYRKAIQKDRKYGEAYYREGLNQLQLGQLVNAMGLLRRAVDLQPENTEAQAKLAEIYLYAYTTDTKNARQWLGEIKDLTNRLLKRDAKSFDGLRLAGYASLADKDLPGALKNFRAANDVKPYQPVLVLALAQTLAATQDFESAEKLSKEIIARDKTYGPIYDFLYLEYGRRNRLNDAEAMLKLKAENNPTDAKPLVQLAGYYFLSGRPREADAVLNKLLENRTSFATARLIVGNFYTRHKEYDKAIQQYEAGIREDAKNKPAYQKQIIVTLTAQGKQLDAAQVAAQLVKEFPKDPDAAQINAALMLQSGTKEQVQNAIIELQRLVTQSPQNFSVRFDLARANMAKGDLESARIQLLESIRLRPDFMPARLALGQIEISKKEFAKAIETAQGILGAGQNAKYLPARLIRSSALIGLGETDKARDDLVSMLAESPSLNDARYQLGLVDLIQKKYKDSEAQFRMLWQGNPPDPRGLMGLVEVYGAEDRYPEAIQVMDAELGKNPQRSDYRLALANLEVRAKRFDDAIKNYNTLLAAYPNASEIYTRLGETQRLKGDTDAAVASFKKAQELNPTEAGAWLRVAMMLEYMHRADEAKPYYTQVLKLQPDNPYALNNLAYRTAEDGGGDLDLALTMAQRAKQKLPNEPDVSDTLGWIYIKKNLSDDAIRLFRDLVRQQPKHPMYRFHLAMALYQKGDRPTAKREATAALHDAIVKQDQAKIQEWLSKVGL